MKKTVLLSTFVLFLLILSGCSSTHSYVMHGPSQLTQAGGLGDTISVFAKNYGKNNGSEEIGQFQNGLINPLFLKEKAYEIMIDFEQSSQTRWTKKQAMDQIIKMIPSDAVKQKEYIAKDDSSREIIEYKSNSLRRAFSEETQLFKPAKPGTFTVMLRKDEKGYYRAVIAIGPY